MHPEIEKPRLRIELRTFTLPRFSGLDV